MTTIRTIPAEFLGGLDVRQGDTLRILASRGNEWVVEIRRDTAGEPRGCGSISQWLRLAKGSVRLEPGEFLRQYPVPATTESRDADDSRS